MARFSSSCGRLRAAASRPESSADPRSESIRYCGVCVATLVADAGRRIQPEARRGLAAAAQRDQQVVGDVALREAGLRRARAVDVDCSVGWFATWWTRRSTMPGTRADLRQQLGRERAVRVLVAADDLHVDRRRQAEVQNLADDVGRDERELDARKLAGQLACAGRACSPPVGLMVLVERDQDVGVAGADRRRVAVGQVQAAVRQPDVVDDARRSPRPGSRRGSRFSTWSHRTRRLLDPRAGRRAQVQLELAAVDRREEILPDPRQQRERARRRPAGTPPRTAARDRGRRPARRGSRRAGARSRARCPAARATNGLRDRGVGRAARAPSAGTSPSSAPASATARTTRASRRRPPRPAARRGTGPRRSGRTSARRRCRCRASRRTPASRSARRRRGSPARAPCPARDAS